MRSDPSARWLNLPLLLMVSLASMEKRGTWPRYSDRTRLNSVRSPSTYSIRLREDVFLTRYAVLPVPVILFFPVLAWLLARRRERKRWQHSDHGA